MRADIYNRILDIIDTNARVTEYSTSLCKREICIYGNNKFMTVQIAENHCSIDGLRVSFDEIVSAVANNLTSWIT